MLKSLTLLLLLTTTLPALSEPLVDWEASGGNGPYGTIRRSLKIETDGRFTAYDSIQDGEEKASGKGSAHGVSKGHVRPQELSELKAALDDLNLARIPLDHKRTPPSATDSGDKILTVWRAKKATRIPLWEAAGSSEWPVVVLVNKLVSKYVYRSKP